MKPFHVNRNSWHYKLNKMTNPQGDNRYYMEDSWEPRHSNFCAYWRATMFKLIWLAMIFFGAGFILFMLGSVFYLHPVESLKVTGIIFGIIMFFVALFFAFMGVSNVTEKVSKSDSLFVQKYRAQKSKICPKVEFE